jgi:uncharacterized protein
MKRILGIAALLISFCAFAQNDKDIPNRPSPPKLVNDFTGSFLTPEQQHALEQKLEDYDRSTSNQVAIVVVESLGDYSADDYAIALGRKWGVGNKEFNNGVVILISTGGGQGNRKAAIQVGYGLEGVVTDLTTKSIVDNSIIPNFKEGNYYRGLDKAVDDIITAAAGRYTAPKGYGQGNGKGRGFGFLGIIIIIIIVSLLGGRGGGRGGGMMSRRGYGNLATGWLIGSMLGGGGSSSGGGSSGGGGGGFGGFGGGSFGGGGSSGSW